MRLTGIILLLFVLAVTASAGDSVSAAQAEDETAIRDAVASYVSAFNQRDAEAVAAHWSENGVWVNPDGNRIEGRAAIQAEMAAYFQEGGAPRITVNSTRIRILADTVAVEEGHARVEREGEDPSETTYCAIHVKREDGWKLDSVHETLVRIHPSNYEKLKELEWMVGTWVDQADDGSVETTCQWTKNRNFLTRSFAVRIDGRIDMEGTQVIGWDARTETIRSWLFDSTGGFGQGVWQRDGDRWIIKLSHVHQDGAVASAINIIKRIDENTSTWESTARESDGELQPNVGPVVVVKKPESAQ